jgi:hypothetical protein
MRLEMGDVVSSTLILPAFEFAGKTGLLPARQLDCLAISKR